MRVARSFEELQKSLSSSELDVSERVKAQLKCIELILAKRHLPPETPQESVDTATQLLKEFKDLETKFDHTRTNTDGVEGRPPTV